MNLSDHLLESCIAVNPEVDDKKSLLKAIAETAKKHKILKKISTDDIYSRLLKRETIGSTGFGNGIAIPHCSIDGIDDFVIGIVTVKEGIDFDSLDGKRVKLFVFIIAPAEKRNEHIHYLSEISSVLRNQTAIDEITTGKDPFSVRGSFLRHIPRTDVKEKDIEYNLLQVFCQSEDKFDEIISILMEVKNINISIIEADNVEKYLHRLPLFSSFWNEARQSYQKLIIAYIEKLLPMISLEN